MGQLLGERGGSQRSPAVGDPPGIPSILGCVELADGHQIEHLPIALILGIEERLHPSVHLGLSPREL